MGGGFDEVVLEVLVAECVECFRCDVEEACATCKRKMLQLRPTHRLCTLVSIAILFGLIELAFPGMPYGTAKLIALDSENCSRRS